MLELHLYQLHREMNVLNRFEAHEDNLAEKVYSKLLQVLFLFYFDIANLITFVKMFR